MRVALQRVVHIVKFKEEKVIVCLDCVKSQPRPAFFVRENTLSYFMTVTGMEKEESVSYLTSFPKKYALVQIGKGNRTYWSWEKEQIINKLLCTHAGEIYKIGFNTSYKEKRKVAKTIDIKNRKYKVVQDVQLTLQKIIIPDEFVSSHPRSEKIQQHIKYYENNQSFNRRVIVQRTEKGWVLLDGYTRYLAAKKLNLKKIDIREVEEVKLVETIIST